MSKRITLSEPEFIQKFQAMGSRKLAEYTGISERNIYQRRRRIEDKLGIRIHNPNANSMTMQARAPEDNSRIEVKIKDGYAVIGSDAHYWPGMISTAHLALLEVCRELEPEVFIANGDMLDGASMSRHPPGQWEYKPTIEEELECVQERMEELYEASKTAKLHAWTLGNHDGRFESRIAAALPELAGVTGVHLKDHFTSWSPCFDVWINDEIVVKHRWNGGMHAAFNNTVKSGKTMVTGHTHRLTCRTYDDLNGSRYGIECGTLAEPWGRQFLYAENNPRDWQSGFVVLSFHEGRMLQPILVPVLEQGKYEFRGEVRTVEVSE